MDMKCSCTLNVQVAGLADETKLTVQSIVMYSVRVNTFEYFHTLPMYASVHCSKVVLSHLMLVEIIKFSELPLTKTTAMYISASCFINSGTVSSCGVDKNFSRFVFIKIWNNNELKQVWWLGIFTWRNCSPHFMQSQMIFEYFVT